MIYEVENEEDLELIAYGGHEDFRTIEESYGYKHRWSIDVKLIVQQVSTGKFYEFKFNEGLTESQEDEFYDNELIEVEEVEVTVKQWMKVV